jgi:peptide deformylase
MAILPIQIYGDKILEKKAKNVKKVDDALVGYEESIFVIDISLAEGYEKSKPIVAINPQIILESDEKVFMEEGCLSLPNLRADVERAEKIKIRFIDTDENEVELEADDLYARVLLHEYDHLLGKTIPDRLGYIVKKKLKKELMLITERTVDIDYPVTEK